MKICVLSAKCTEPGRRAQKCRLAWLYTGSKDYSFSVPALYLKLFCMMYVEITVKYVSLIIHYYSVSVVEWLCHTRWPQLGLKPICQLPSQCFCLIKWKSCIKWFVGTAYCYSRFCQFSNHFLNNYILCITKWSRGYNYRLHASRPICPSCWVCPVTSQNLFPVNNCSLNWPVLMKFGIYLHCLEPCFESMFGVYKTKDKVTAAKYRKSVSGPSLILLLKNLWFIIVHFCLFCITSQHHRMMKTLVQWMRLRLIWRNRTRNSVISHMNLMVFIGYVQFTTYSSGLFWPNGRRWLRGKCRWLRTTCPSSL